MRCDLLTHKKPTPSQDSIRSLQNLAGTQTAHGQGVQYACQRKQEEDNGKE
jgi:hypothetical protein